MQPDYFTFLSKDKKLKKILKDQPPFVLKKQKKIYLRLCKSILSQQLSTRVAKVLYERFLNLFDGREPSAQEVLDMPVASFRAIGFSQAKANYVHNVCRFFIENKLTDAQLHRMNNDEVIDLLTQIKGVGRWTVEMILMFSLGREDIFAIDDLGLKQRVVRLYMLEETDAKLLRKQILTISDRWSPYRTYACRHLWNWE